jgi:hypothetical protein
MTDIILDDAILARKTKAAIKAAEMVAKYSHMMGQPSFEFGSIASTGEYLKPHVSTTVGLVLPKNRTSGIDTANTVKAAIKAQNRELRAGKGKPTAELGYIDNRHIIDADKFRLGRRLQLDAKQFQDRQVNKVQINEYRVNAKLSGLESEQRALRIRLEDTNREVSTLANTLNSFSGHYTFVVGESDETVSVLQSRKEIGTRLSVAEGSISSIKFKLIEIGIAIEKMLAEKKPVKPKKASSKNKSWGKTDYLIGEHDSGKRTTLTLTKRQTVGDFVSKSNGKPEKRGTIATIQVMSGSISSVKKNHSGNTNKMNKAVDVEAVIRDVTDNVIHKDKGENIRNLTNTEINARHEDGSKHNSEVASVMAQSDKSYTKKQGGSPKSGGITVGKLEKEERDTSTNAFMFKHGSHKMKNRPERGLLIRY